MMAGKLVLDSNIVIDLLRGDKNTIEKVRKISEIYIPVIVLGELYYGANRSGKVHDKRIEIEELERQVIMLDCNKNTAKVYGDIKDQLRQKGTPIPENDIWIAAIAKENNLKLATRDKHFDRVEGVDIEKW